MIASLSCGWISKPTPLPGPGSLDRFQNNRRRRRRRRPTAPSHHGLFLGRRFEVLKERKNVAALK